MQPSTNGRVSFDNRRREALHYTGNNHPRGLDDDRDGVAVPPVPGEDWLPQDRWLLQFLVGLFQCLGMFLGQGQPQQAAATPLGNPQSFPDSHLPPPQTTLPLAVRAPGVVTIGAVRP